MADYLKLPIRFSQFFSKNKLDTVPIKESIARNLHLLITTSLGENKQDLQYGSLFWDADYDVHVSNDARREMVINTLKRQIALYEKRLVNVALEVNVKQAEYQILEGTQLRRRIELIITASLQRSNEPFRFQTGFFIGPLSFD